MKIQHNRIAYLAPIVICLLFILGGIGGLISPGSQVESPALALFGLLVLVACISLCCWINYKTNTLELKKGLVQGKRGWIKKITLSTAVSNISYCEYTEFLCFNKIRINALTGTYIFKNMSDAEEFVDMINEVQGG